MIGTRHILGLAIDDWGVVAAELRVRSGHPEVHVAAELSWKQELTAQNAAELGGELRRFLRDKGFTSRRAVVGLAAKWVLAKEVEVPSADPDALSGILSIQAERAFSLNVGELIFDYCGRVGASGPSRVLLFAAPRQVVNRVKALTDAAGLHTQSVTVSALACSEALSGTEPQCRYGLYARPTYCEFWSQSDDGPRFIKHVAIGKDGTTAGYADVLASTIQRFVLLSSGQGRPPPHQITAYNACGLPDDTVDEVNRRLAPEISLCDGRAGLQVRGLGIPEHPEGGRSVAAAAVAATAVEGGRPAVDFLNPRIGRHQAAGRTRKMAWAGFIAAACLIGLGAVLADWRRDVADIGTYSAQLEQMSEDVVAAREIIDRVAYAGSWSSRQPQFLDCLKELTEAFPDEPSIWATNLALNENGEGRLVGKATSEPSFYAVLDAITKNETAFSDVTMIHFRDAGRDSREKEFMISFTFQGVKSP